MGKPIVVGINGSAGSEAAMTWALHRAARFKLPVIAIHAVDDRWMSPDFQYHELIRESGMELLRQVQEDAAKKEPDVAVDVQLRHGSAGSALKDMSKEAAMVVIGSHHRHWADGGPMTDRALQVVTASDSPVAVIPQAQGPQGRGVSPAARKRPALPRQPRPPQSSSSSHREPGSADPWSPTHRPPPAASCRWAGQARAAADPPHARRDAPR